MKKRWLSIGVWTLLVASVVAWSWRILKPLAAPQAAEFVAQAEQPVRLGTADLLRLLGAQLAPSSAPAALQDGGARYTLQGVLAGAQGRTGVALIAIDGKPARAYAVGARVDGELLLESLQTRSASLAAASGTAAIHIALPGPWAPGSSAAMARAGSPAQTVPGSPSVRTAAAGEMIAPGRRQRLQAARPLGAPAAP